MGNRSWEREIQELGREKWEFFFLLIYSTRNFLFSLSLFLFTRESHFNVVMRFEVLRGVEAAGEAWSGCSFETRG
jgi:hypothetical protein